MFFMALFLNSTHMTVLHRPIRLLFAPATSTQIAVIRQQSTLRATSLSSCTSALQFWRRTRKADGYWAQSLSEASDWEVYRVETADGAVPASYTGISEHFEVGYTAEYWFYHS
jgi:hypothetical protein